jgi:hypothetical protein
VDSAEVRAALRRCRTAQTAPPREGFTAFNARQVAEEIAAQTSTNRTDSLFELRRWAVTVGAYIKPAVLPPTKPRPLFLYVPDRLVPP